MKTKLLLWMLVVILATSVSFASSYQTNIHSTSVSISPQLDSPGSFKTDLFPGSATYAYDIVIPPARSISPSVSLYYNSHMTKNTPTELESAWSLSKNYIQLDINGEKADELTLVFMGRSYTLVNLSYWNYKTKFESFLNITRTFDDTWKIISPEGTVHVFETKISHPKVTSSAKWYLTSSTDTFGNTVFYSYKTFPESIGVWYLDYITYDDLKRIDFSYDTKPKSYSTYFDSVEMKYSHRLTGITTSVDSEMLSQYVISYTTVGLYKQFVHTITRLATPNQVVTFEYNEPQIGWVEDTRFQLPLAASFGTDEDQGARFMDLNGDGILDFYKLYGKSPTSWQQVKLLGSPNGWKSVNWDFIENDGEITYQGLDQGYRFVDVNGDLFADVVQLQCNDVDNEEHVYINTGTEWIEDTTYDLRSMPCVIDFSDIENEGIVFTDVTGDGLVDIVQSKSGSNRVYENLGDGTGWDYEGMQVPEDFASSSGTDRGVRLGDINGDGLPDIIENKFQQKAWLNTGYRWVETFDWDVNEGFEFIEIRSGPDDDKGVRLADVDGDGLVDFIRADDDANVKQVWINTGKEWVETAVTIPTYFVDNRNDNLGVRIVDFNGDTYPDIVLVNDDEQRSWRHIGEANYYLNEISYTNVVQPRTEISYVPSTIYNHTLDGISTLGFPLFVVDEIIQYNDAEGNFSIVSVVKQNYTGGVYDASEKEFTGFRTVISTDFDTTTISEFHQDFQRRGHLQYSSVQDLQGNALQNTFYTWSYLENSGVYQTQLDSMRIIDFGPSGNRSSSVNYEYDEYNNVIVEIQNGEDFSVGDEKYTYTNYSINTNKWILSNPSVVSLFNADNELVSEALFAYDGLSVGQAPVKGALTKELLWDGENYLETIYEYDSFGNVIKEKNPKGQEMRYSFGDVEQTSTFPDSVTNDLGFKTSYQYDVFGNIIAETDANLRTTQYFYDDIGRLIGVLFPEEQKNRSMIEYGYGPNVFLIKETQFSGKNGEFENVLMSYIDSFGNVMQTKQYRVGEPDIVAKETFYNPDLTVKSQTPLFESVVTNFSSYENTDTISYAYDVLDRSIMVTNIDGTKKETVFDAWEKRTYDEDNNSVEFFYDAYKRVVAIKENTDDESYITHYAYDANDNLVLITRADSSEVSFEYDALSRELKEVDGDFTKEYSYDALGNVLSVTYPTRKESFKYDELNRITEKRSNSGVFDFYYDVSEKGTLSYVEGSNYKKTFAYDSLYRTIGQLITINGQDFTTNYTYGYSDELLLEIYPEETIEYVYDFASRVSELDSIATIEYTPIGVVDKIDYENDLITDFEYDEDTLRLSRIDFGDQELAYTYTDSGLLRSISGIESKNITYDGLSRIMSEIVGGAKTVFTIDSVGRIISVENPSELILYTYNGFDAPMMISNAAPRFISACQDGIDNDNDGLIDLFDLDCLDEFDNDENTSVNVSVNGNSSGLFQSPYQVFGSISIRIPKNASLSEAYILIRGSDDER